jgi:membrane-bound lytic murein transglycosylase D
MLVLAVLFLASSCTTKQQISTSALDIAPADTESSELDPDLEPLIAEPEISLDQELEALAMTGPWEEPLVRSEETQICLDPELAEPLYDFPVVVNRQVQMYIDLFQGKQRKYFARWLGRSGHYSDLIKKELEAAGIPKDLLYLAMIESGFNQRAYSKSRAVGLWQFMLGTGRDYGLSVTRYVDERRDAEKSTKAAAAYLKDLYEEFGDWYLAVAAYNGGPGTMRKAIRKSKSRDFWKIAQNRYLRMETKRYVPKLIAAIMIAKQPEKYGFTDIAYAEPMAWETLEVGPGLSMTAVAILTNSSEKDIKLLNQELRSSRTPLNQERYQVKIPSGTKLLAQSNLPRLHSVVQTDYKTHIVKQGETLSGICRRYNINTTTLLKVNKLTSRNLKAGSRLRIPYQNVAHRILPEGMDARIAAKDDLILHTVKRGETVSEISNRYQVPAELIVAWNGLPSIHKIAAGQQLALFMSSTSPTSRSTASSASASAEASLLVLSDSKKRSATSTVQDDPYTYYLVRSGDSLWTISRKFNTSPDRIKRWNNLKSNLIHPGNTLKLKDV